MTVQGRTLWGVRLVGGSQGGSALSAGRLEVNYDGVWGTVCDDWFDNAAASVACYMLGFRYS